MNQPPSSDVANANPPEEPALSRGDLQTIRDLLFGQERRQLEGLQERIENPGLHARDVGRVLPLAVTIASTAGGQLSAALTPVVESALKESVKRDSSILVNAIFPIIGPAIRKSIAETFSKLVQSLNHTLEHSLSPRGLKWRLEAIRSGKSFAEVVLAHTLVYRVEQIFLIHKRTGLLLQQLAAPHIRAQDPDMVSGMLTAIQDFARDSFHVGAGEALHTLQIGELDVWVESSPLVTLAAVIRGRAPYEFRTVLQNALENIHAEQGPALESFDGDAAPFELARVHLEPCLQMQFASAAKRATPSWLPLLAGVVALLLLAWLGLSIREQRRWAGFLARLETEPGIVVMDAGRRGGEYFVKGMRDPLAADPALFLPEFKLSKDQVVGRWEPYQALSEELVQKRAGLWLQPPAGAALRLQEGVLSATGSAPGSWIRSARARALTIPGVHSYDDSQLVDGTLADLAAQLRKSGQVVVVFQDGVQLAPGQGAVVDALATQIRELGRVAMDNGRRLRVAVVGHTDKTGTEEVNSRLSRQRAEHVVGLLVARGVPAAWLTEEGVGPREPWPVASPDTEHVQNRRVSFRIELEQPGTP